MRNLVQTLKLGSSTAAMMAAAISFGTAAQAQDQNQGTPAVEQVVVSASRITSQVIRPPRRSRSSIPPRSRAMPMSISATDIRQLPSVGQSWLAGHRQSSPVMVLRATQTSHGVTCAISAISAPSCFSTGSASSCPTRTAALHRFDRRCRSPNASPSRDPAYRSGDRRRLGCLGLGCRGGGRQSYHRQDLQRHQRQYHLWRLVQGRSPPVKGRALRWHRLPRRSRPCRVRRQLDR